MSAGINNKKSLATKLLATAIMFSIVFSFTIFLPYPANALIPGTIVPVSDAGVLPGGLAQVAAGAATSKLSLKSIQDQLLTMFLKTIIRLARNIVLRWITTGRFEQPVFSAGFAFDAKKAAENASRLFLQDISGIPFCQGFNIPETPGLSLNLRLALECSLPRAAQNNDLDMFLHPERYSDSTRQLALEPENIYPWTYIKALEAKAQAEANAINSFAAEYAAGQGYRDIRSEVTGLIKTPGKYVADLVTQTNIVSPQRTADVANTAQQAVDAIVQTAIQTVVERGLTAVFSPPGAGGGGGGGAAVLPPPPEKPVISRKINAFIERGRNFIPVAVAAAGISEREVNSINSIITTLTDLQIRLGPVTDPEVIRSINANVDSLGDQLELTIASTRLCVQPSPPAICPTF